MGNHLKKTFIGAALAATMLVVPQAAMAVYSINFNGFICADNAACDLNPTAGQMTVQAGAGGVPNFAGFTGSVTTSFTNSPGGSPFAVLDMTWNVSAINNTGGVFQVLASATGFTFPGTGLPAILTSELGGTIVNAGSTSVRAQQWANLANLLFGKGPVTPGLQGPFTAGSFHDTHTISFVSITPYSLTEELDFIVGANSATTGDFQSTVRTVPEPATLLLLGTGLLGLAALRRKQA